LTVVADWELEAATGTGLVGAAPAAGRGLVTTFVAQLEKPQATRMAKRSGVIFIRVNRLK
jgi:hypothetical protein